jgi:hypothetical protein
LCKTLFTFAVFLLATACTGHSAKNAPANRQVMTEKELQTDLMGFADRFTSYIYQGWNDYLAAPGDLASREIVQADLLLSSMSGFTIAADQDPPSALLDMTAMVTVGRLVYEEHWRRIYGDSMIPIADAYARAEREIWAVAARLLDTTQQAALRDLILQWRKEHPGQNLFAYLRFGYMTQIWKDSGSAQAKQAGGLFQSVRDATRQVEEARLLAERGMYLATRIPLLAGNFADYWTSDLAKNPHIGNLIGDVHRLAKTIEQLPGVISQERSAAVRQSMEEINSWSRSTIDRTMDRVAVERQAALAQFFAELNKERKDITEELIREEKAVTGLLRELRGALAEGGMLLESATGLADKFASDGPKSDAPPVSIQDVRGTIVEVKETIKALREMLAVVDQMTDSPRWNAAEMLIRSSVDQAGDEGEALIDHSFRRVMLLIAAGIVMLFVAQVLFFFIKRTLEGRRKASAAVDT